MKSDAEHTAEMLAPIAIFLIVVYSLRYSFELTAYQSIFLSVIYLGILARLQKIKDALYPFDKEEG